jgi:hypothetical protein
MRFLGGAVENLPRRGVAAEREALADVQAVELSHDHEVAILHGLFQDHPGGRDVERRVVNGNRLERPIRDIDEPDRRRRSGGGERVDRERVQVLDALPDILFALRLPALP